MKKKSKPADKKSVTAPANESLNRTPPSGTRLKKTKSPAKAPKTISQKAPKIEISVAAKTPFAEAAVPGSREAQIKNSSMTHAEEPVKKPATDRFPAKKPGKRRLPLPAPKSGVPLKIPSILLEGDAAPAPEVGGPGMRYALATQTVTPSLAAGTGHLPDAYGTGRIFLTARDPHWLYVSWDFTQRQQREFNAKSRDGHLVLRVFAKDTATTVYPEVHLHPESKDWFVNVPRAETRYWAEIGFYDRHGSWQTVSVSTSTFTPPKEASRDLTAHFATIPPEVTFKQVLETVEEFVATSEGQPLLEAVAKANEVQFARIEMRERQRPQPSAQVKSARSLRSEVSATKPERKRRAIPIRIETAHPWSTEQRESLKRLIHMDEQRRVWINSIEITELVRRQLEEEIASIAAQERRRVPLEISGERGFEFGISSPQGGETRRARKFWFNVNAELIVYGSTEPDAKVTVAGRPIKLRPDGSFSFRFSLPDGQYQLPAVAVSNDGEEAREAQLEFTRSTEYRGKVEAHPQNGVLRPPRAEHIQ
jgi:uncharacterized protein